MDLKVKRSCMQSEVWKHCCPLSLQDSRAKEMVTALKGRIVSLLLHVFSMSCQASCLALVPPQREALLVPRTTENVSSLMASSAPGPHLEAHTAGPSLHSLLALMCSAFTCSVLLHIPLCNIALLHFSQINREWKITCFLQFWGKKLEVNRRMTSQRTTGSHLCVRGCVW